MLKIIGWTVYIAFALLSLLVVIVATAGFWPTFAWLLLLLAAPRLVSLNHVGNSHACTWR